MIFIKFSSITWKTPSEKDKKKMRWRDTEDGSFNQMSDQAWDYEEPRGEGSDISDPTEKWSNEESWGFSVWFSTSTCYAQTEPSINEEAESLFSSFHIVTGQHRERERERGRIFWPAAGWNHKIKFWFFALVHLWKGE